MQDKNQKKSRISMGNVAILLVITSLLGQVLGFLRTKLVNGNFSALGPHSTDAYFAAFNIPDFFFFTIAAGALGVAFMPVLSDHLQKGDRKGMWEISSSLLNLLGAIMFVIAVILVLFAKPLIHYIVAPDLNPQQLDNAASIMRWLAFNPFFFTVSGILTSAQQTLGRFFFYAIAPLFYNASIIVSIYVFHNTSTGLVGLGIGAFVGGLLQLLIVIFGLIGTNFSWRKHIMWRSRDFRLVLKQLPARSVDQGMDQIQSIIETRFARRLGEGFVSYYNNAYILHTAPILLLGTAISTAAFPRLNERLSQGRPDLFRRDFLRVLRVMIWMTIPVVIVSFYTRGYLARLIFSNNQNQIALIFGYLTVAIFFRTMYAIISRWFYAQKDTRTPLVVSVLVIGLNVILAALLARPSTYGVAGLALAQSIVAMVEVTILSAVMLVRDRALFDPIFWAAIIKILSVAGFALVAGYIAISWFPLGVNDRGFVLFVSKLTIIASIIFGVYLGASSIFGLEESKAVFERVRRLILKPIRIVY